MSEIEFIHKSLFSRVQCRRGASMTQVPPLAHIGSVALRRVNRNIVVVMYCVCVRSSDCMTSGRNGTYMYNGGRQVKTCLV